MEKYEVALQKLAEMSWKFLTRSASKRCTPSSFALHGGASGIRATRTCLNRRLCPAAAQGGLWRARRLCELAAAYCLRHRQEPSVCRWQQADRHWLPPTRSCYFNGFSLEAEQEDDLRVRDVRRRRRDRRGRARRPSSAIISSRSRAIAAPAIDLIVTGSTRASNTPVRWTAVLDCLFRRRSPRSPIPCR